MSTSSRSTKSNIKLSSNTKMAARANPGPGTGLSNADTHKPTGSKRHIGALSPPTIEQTNQNQRSSNFTKLSKDKQIEPRTKFTKIEQVLSENENPAPR